ncbi:MAG: rhomboid family intramembrane serine protease [Lachnospiraceae bacterium]|nr:rhomboid family intramembrane serine protease [Lachnospiraceae bacterium]
MLQKWKSLPIVSGLLVGINILLFLLCTFSGNLIYNMGGMDVWNTLYYGEYYRILSAMFLHADIQHLFNNMILAFVVGSILEKQMGHLMYGLAYFLCGIGGNVLSLLYKLQYGITAGSIGASGAVFGLDGILLMLVLLSGRRLLDVTPVRLIGVLFLSLYSSFGMESVDNAAHVGGLITGLVIGVIASIIIRFSDKRKQNVRC